MNNKSDLLCLNGSQIAGRVSKVFSDPISKLNDGNEVSNTETEAHYDDCRIAPEVCICSQRWIFGHAGNVCGVGLRDKV